MHRRKSAHVGATALVVVVLAMLAALGCSQDEQASRQRFREAVTDQDLVAARTAALALGRDLPDTPEAVVQVARMLADIGEMNEARWLLEAAVARHPDDVHLVLGLAETSLMVGDAAAAEQALDTLPANNERAAYAEVLRSRALMLTGRLEEALALLMAAEHRHDEPVLFRVERIDLLMSEERWTEALAVVHEMQADPTVPSARRAWLAQRESDLVLRIDGGEAALPLLDAILEADPSAVDAARSRTSILIMLGQAGEALAGLEEMLAVHPELVALHAFAAQAAGASGDVETAERHLRQHVEADPNATTLDGLARFLHQQGRVREAVFVLEAMPEGVDPVQRIELRHQLVAMQIEAGDLDDAQREIEAFGRDHPGNPRHEYLLARLDLTEKRPEDAVRRLSWVLSRLDRSDVRHLLGVALEQSGDLEGAEVQYGIVATQNASQLSSWAGLMRVLEAQRKWDRLAASAQLASRMAAIRDLALQTLVTAHVALGRDQAAEQVARAHLKERPELVEARVGLAVALRRQGRLEEAMAVLDAADEAQQHDPRLVAERVTLLAASHRTDEALEVLEQAEAEQLATPRLRQARIYLLFESGRTDAALAEAARAAELAPDDATPHRMAADYLASTGRFGESLAHYRRAVELAPAAGEVWFRMAIALEQAGRGAEAAAAYQRAIELDAHAIGARNNLALVLGREGRTREAIEVAQAAYARAENDPVVIDTLASLYLDAGLARRAAAMLEKARGLDPDSQDVSFHLALAYRDMGRSDDARQILSGLGDRQGVEPELQGRIDDALSTLR